MHMHLQFSNIHSEKKLLEVNVIKSNSSHSRQLYFHFPIILVSVVLMMMLLVQTLNLLYRYVKFVNRNLKII